MAKKSGVFFGKKAISPLIATVLLIAFAIALGAIVMNFGKEYVKTSIEESRIKSSSEKECSDNIELDVKEIAGRPQICYTYSSTNLTIDFMLQNNGPKTIEGIRIVAIGADGSVNQTGKNFKVENASISKGGILKNITAFTVPSSFADLVQVEFFAYLNTTGSAEPTLCTKNPLVVSGDDLAKC